MKDAQSLENSVSPNFDGRSLLVHVEDINSRSVFIIALATLYIGHVLQVC